MGLAEFFIGLLFIIGTGVALVTFSDVINEYRQQALDDNPSMDIVSQTFLIILMPLIWFVYLGISVLFIIVLRGGLGDGI